MSTSRLQKTNQSVRELEDFRRLIEALESTGNRLAIDWPNHSVDVPSSIRSIFEGKDWGTFETKQNVYRLNDKGFRAFVRLFVPFSNLTEKTFDRYRFGKILGIGSESIVFLASHITLGTKFAIKLFTERSAEQAFEKVTGALREKQLVSTDALVLPIDEFDLPLNDVFENKIILHCAVFPFVTGSTLRAFCRDNSPLSPYFVTEFISQLTRALYELEKAQISHGDLHFENILVTKATGVSVSFRIVDLSGLISETDRQTSDFESFKDILIHLLSMLPLRNMSLQRHLGPRLYELIKDIFTGPVKSFSGLKVRMDAGIAYAEYEVRRTRFLEKTFRAGQVLTLFRHEELVDPAVAREMFLPYKGFFQDFCAFGNAILYGNRGSGKSSYMASIALYPAAEKCVVNPELAFGLLFACRQGEFRQYSVLPEESLRAKSAQILDLIITKVIRKTLKVLSEFVSVKNDSKYTLDPLLAFLTKAYSGRIFQTDGLSQWESLDSLYQIIVRHETELQLALLDTAKAAVPPWLGSEDLAGFFQSLRQSFERFSTAQFFVLFDDAGTPNLPPAIQAAINDLLASRNPIFCVKVSAERNSYNDRDSTGTPLEASHDVAMFNLSEIYFVPSGRSANRNELREYFKELVELRLTDFRSKLITTYLGDTVTKTVDLICRLATRKPRDAYFAGWDIVWQLANSNPRVLLELISSIFTRSQVSDTSKPTLIEPVDQEAAIIAYSEYKLRALKYLPGKLMISGQPVATGQQIFSIATTFGKVARDKLRDDAKFKVKRPKGRRFSEMLAIELDKGCDLSNDADTILRELVRFGVFDDCRFVRAWDDGIKKSLYVFNRIYTPALEMSFRRDIHWRINPKRFMEFLINPTLVHQYGKTGAPQSSPEQDELL